ncbi:MAG TPA: glycosyltransferase 87 family protein [Actinophytocola sp.]|uniref:glycosyltransferase 87 family protein n=1 Tax=Actinophytocola sp. TaxID=1872138 RepID=UPI002DBBB94F|nr:glycosyltransferase 87 family protein [Actinophytocola sp.]HEU5474860.1 glycosyltransferase 87 family protein [Actinophytocola sp.]
MSSTTDVTEPDAAAADVDEEQPAPPARTGQDWTVRRVARILAPALIFLGIREFGLLMLTLLAAANQLSMSAQLQAWDGQWFIGLAENGYGGIAGLGLVDARGEFTAETPLAFFPGYPFAVRIFGQAIGIGPATAAIILTLVCGVIAAYGVARIGRQVRGGSQRTGLILVVLFAASPMAIVLSTAYSEAMFCALAAWALVGVLERRWVLAGVCCAVAGLVRPTAAALILAVGLAALVAVIQRKDSWRPWLAGVLAPVGLIGYLAWVGVRTGRWDGWFQVQQDGWQSGFDGGAATMDFILRKLVRPDYPFEMFTIAFIFVAIGLVVLAIVRRLEWPLLVYGIGVLAMALASNGLMASKIRLMLPAFTLLIPVAVALARRRNSTMVLTLCGLTVFSAWLGAYGLTSWNFAI